MSENSAEPDGSTNQRSVVAKLAQQLEDAEPPLERLALFSELSVELEALLPDLVAQARALKASDSEIARHLGVSRQAVSQRFPRSSPAPGVGNTGESINDSPTPSSLQPEVTRTPPTKRSKSAAGDWELLLRNWVLLRVRRTR